MNEYNKLSAAELRELLLEDKLLHELMTEEDYTALFDNEAEADEPSEKVIDFCFAGLSSLSEYSDIEERSFDINDLFIEKQKKGNIKKYRKTKRFFLVAVIAIFTFLLSQIVASALGFDLFGYIFNWNKPEVVVIKNDDITNQDVNENQDDNENQRIEYSNVDEIPDEMKNLVPNCIFNNYQFYRASFKKIDNSLSYTYIFLDKNECFLTFSVEQSKEVNIEKDDNGYYEEYE